MAAVQWFPVFCALILRFCDADYCPPMPQVTNAYPVNVHRDDIELPLGAIVTYKCRIGYYLEGNPRLKCIRNTSGRFNWTLPTFNCDPVSCPSPDFPENGRVKGTMSTFGFTVTYTCRPGYELYSADGLTRLERSPVRQCNAEGHWSGEMPQCKVILCDQPLDPDNGFVNYETLTFGSRIKYSCFENYQLEGDSQRECQENGLWSGVQPNCSEKLEEGTTQPPTQETTEKDTENNEQPSLWQRFVKFCKDVANKF